MASMLEKEAMIVRLDEEGTYALEGASDALKDDKDVILAAMTTGNGGSLEALEYASERLRDDRDVMLAAMAVADDAEVLEFASERLRDDTGFIRALIAMSPATHGSTWFGSEWLRHASERLENDEGMLLLLKLHEEGADAMMEEASDEHKDDKDFLLTAVALDELVLQHASERLKDDKAVVLAAVSKAESQSDDSGSGHALKFASDERQNDKEMVVAALANGWALQDVPEELKNDKDVVSAAVSADENALHYAVDGAKNDPAVLLAAVALYGARKVGHCDKASLDYAHPTLQAVPTLQRVGAITDDAERAAAAADPATVLAVEAEHQAIQATPLDIWDLGGNHYPLAAPGWWAAPGGDLVAMALAQHPALAEANQRFELVTSDGTATPATVPLLLSGGLATPPKATLMWLALSSDGGNADADGGATKRRPAAKRRPADAGGVATKRLRREE